MQLKIRIEKRTNNISTYRRVCNACKFLTECLSFYLFLFCLHVHCSTMNYFCMIPIIKYIMMILMIITQQSKIYSQLAVCLTQKTSLVHQNNHKLLKTKYVLCKHQILRFVLFIFCNSNIWNCYHLCFLYISIF